MNADNFLSSFGHIASAPEGINRLREMIYYLAITGALTEQRMEEGDGRDLLDRILSKKQQLIAAGEYKQTPKLENLREVFNENLPRIPDTWSWTRLVEIGEISPKNECPDETLVSFVPMSTISEKHSSKINAETRSWASVKKGYTHFANGDVVLAKITPCFENGKAAIVSDMASGLGAGTTELHVVRPIAGCVIPGFIYIFLRSPYFKAVGEGYMTGTAGQKRLPTEYFATRPMPLPPLAEQERILAKVEELMSLCDELEAQQQKRESLFPVLSRVCHTRFSESSTPATLDRIFDASGAISPDDMRGTILNLAATGLLVDRIVSDGDSASLVDDIKERRRHLIDSGVVRGVAPLSEINLSEKLPRVPSHWQWMLLGNIASKIGSGSTPRGGSQVYVAKGIPFLRSQNIWNEGIRLDDVVFIDTATHEVMRNTQVAANDILLNITGASLGRCACVPSDFPIANVSQHVTIIRPILPDTRHFIRICLISPFGQQMIWSRQVGMAREGLSKKVLERFEIPIPPLAEQRRIVAKVEELMAIVDQLETQQIDRDKLAETFAKACVASFTGTTFESKEKMKAPKTELISFVTLGKTPIPEGMAPLATLLVKHNGKLPAKSLWQQSGFTIDEFYQHLKNEIAQGYISPPKEAQMEEVAEPSEIIFTTFSPPLAGVNVGDFPGGNSLPTHKRRRP